MTDDGRADDDPSELPVMSLTLTSSTIPPATLTRIADPGIVRDLRAVPGVGDVTVSGGITREMTVQVRPVDLQANGISVADVVQALAQQNLAAPVGRVNGTLSEKTIRLRGRVALSPGPAYGSAGAGFARLNFATDPELVEEAVRRIAAAL